MTVIEQLADEISALRRKLEALSTQETGTFISPVTVKMATPELVLAETDAGAHKWTFVVDTDQLLVQRDGVDMLVVSNSARLTVKGNLFNNDDTTFQIGATAASSQTQIFSNNVVRITISSAGDVTIAQDLIVNGDRVRFTALPTSAAGLVAGDLWRNAGVVNIV